ncbi:MAG: SGNH/GDSL hydrolase family protein [Anaerolineae bacterium]|nr:SGNH/GDSL hydrolase family protein [Anaerolineae bacterium]MDW8172887.1 SGNH/GDSL hydrolase family protein [Anaerolineae bacterium]
MQSYCRSTALVILVTLGFLVGLEALARLLNWRSPQAEAVRDGFGYGLGGLGDLTPNLDSIETLYPLRPYRLRTNDAGLRNVDPIDFSEETVRVLAIGDSFMYGYYVHNEEATPSRLEEVLNQRWETRYQVLNAGVPGYTAADMLDYLRDKGLRTKPRVVVMGFYTNDFFDYLPPMREFFTRRTLLQASVLPAAQTQGLGGWLSRHSALYNSLLSLSGQLAQARIQQEVNRVTPQVVGLEDTYRALTFLQADDPQYVPYYDAYARDLRAIAELLRQEGIALLLVAWPDLAQLPPDNGMGDAPQRFLARLTTELGVAYLDLLPIYRQVGDVQSLYLMYYRDKLIDYGKPDFATMAFWGDGHPSMYGHLMAARAIAQRLSDADLIPR